MSITIKLSNDIGSKTTVELHPEQKQQIEFSGSKITLKNVNAIAVISFGGAVRILIAPGGAHHFNSNSGILQARVSYTN